MTSRALSWVTDSKIIERIRATSPHHRALSLNLRTHSYRVECTSNFTA